MSLLTLYIVTCHWWWMSSAFEIYRIDKIQRTQCAIPIVQSNANGKCYENLIENCNYIFCSGLFRLHVRYEWFIYYIYNIYSDTTLQSTRYWLSAPFHVAWRSAYEFRGVYLSVCSMYSVHSFDISMPWILMLHRCTQRKRLVLLLLFSSLFLSQFYSLCCFVWYSCVDSFIFVTNINAWIIHATSSFCTDRWNA